MQALFKVFKSSNLLRTIFAITTKPQMQSRPIGINGCEIFRCFAKKKIKSTKKDKNENEKKVLREEFQGVNDDSLILEMKTKLTAYEAACDEELSKIKIAHADKSMFDNTRVRVHKNVLQLSEISTISVKSFNQIQVNVHDSNIIDEIMKSLNKEVKDINCEIQGKNIIITLSGSDFDIKGGVQKQVKAIIDSSIKAIRDDRREILGKCKKMGKIISKDDEKRTEKQLDELAQKTIADIMKKQKKKLDEISNH